MSVTTLRVSVDEDTMAKLQMRADWVRKDPEFMAAHLLKTATQVLPKDNSRVVPVYGEVLEKLESVLCNGQSILNPADLQKKVERLAGISFLHVRLPFTPSQLEELARKAKSQGLTVEQLVDRTAPRIYDQFFDLMARSV